MFTRKNKKEIQKRSWYQISIESKLGNKGKTKGRQWKLEKMIKIEKKKEKEKGTALKNLESVLVQAADERHPCEVNLRSHTCIKKTTCQA